MTSLKQLLASGAMIGLLAAPVYALDVGEGGTPTNESGPNTAAENTGTSNSEVSESGPNTNPDSTGQSTADDPNNDSNTSMETAAGEEMEYMADETSAFAANAVYSSDGEVIGSVEQVMKAADGQLKLMVRVDPAVDTEVEVFSLRLDADSVADGEVRLGVTKDALFDSLDG